MGYEWNVARFVLVQFVRTPSAKNFAVHYIVLSANAKIVCSFFYPIRKYLLFSCKNLPIRRIFPKNPLRFRYFLFFYFMLSLSFRIIAESRDFFLAAAFR